MTRGKICALRSAGANQATFSSSYSPTLSVRLVKDCALRRRQSCLPFACALFVTHKLWTMSSIVCLIALISVRPGLDFLGYSRMLQGIRICVCSCDIRTKSLSAIVSLACCKRPRHDHNLLRISQAGMDWSMSVSLSLSLRKLCMARHMLLPTGCLGTATAD